MTAVKYGALTVTVNTILCLILMNTPLNFAGLALASSLAMIFNAWLLFRGRRRLLGPFWTAETARTLFVAGVAATIMGLVCWLGFSWSVGQFEQIGRLLLTGILLSWVGVGVVVYGLTCHLLRQPDLRELAAIILRRKP